MKAVIQAGGLGTRLYPITREIPKPLLPVKRKAILSHLVGFLIRNGIDRVGVVVSKNHEDRFSLWHSGFESRDRVVVFVEAEPSGTFGWLRQIKNWLGDDAFVLVNGDTLLDFDLANFVAFHRKTDAVATIALVETDHPEDCGVVLMDGDYVKEFIEKPENPPTNLISSGLYVCSSSIFDYDDPSRNFVMIEHHIFPRLASEGRLAGRNVSPALYYDCGTLERWEKAMNEWPHS